MSATTGTHQPSQSRREGGRNERGYYVLVVVKDLRPEKPQRAQAYLGYTDEELDGSADFFPAMKITDVNLQAGDSKYS